MGVAEKMEVAKKNNWIIEGLSEAEKKTTIELAKISARLERCRVEMGMTQKEFADYMNVTQGMVSKWESREYNFTIRSLNEICQKIDLKLSISIDKPCFKSDYVVIPWDEDRIENKAKCSWIKLTNIKGAIA